MLWTMERLLLWFSLLASWTIHHLADGFNLEPRLPVIKHGLSGSYFGYSVAQHQSINEAGSAFNWSVIFHFLVFIIYDVIRNGRRVGKTKRDVGHAPLFNGPYRCVRAHNFLNEARSRTAGSKSWRLFFSHFIIRQLILKWLSSFFSFRDNPQHDVNFHFHEEIVDSAREWMNSKWLCLISVTVCWPEWHHSDANNLLTPTHFFFFLSSFLSSPFRCGGNQKLRNAASVPLPTNKRGQKKIRHQIRSGEKEALVYLSMLPRKPFRVRESVSQKNQKERNVQRWMSF